MTAPEKALFHIAMGVIVSVRYRLNVHGLLQFIT